MKKLFCVILAICLSVSLAGCGSSRPSAESVVEDAIQSFQNTDFAKMQQYWGDTNITAVAAEPTSPDDEYTQQLFKTLGSNLTYQITGSSEDADAGTAEVTVDFTNVDMSVVLPEWFGEIFSQSLGYAFLPADQQPSEDELSQMYMETLNSIIESHKDEKVTYTVDISLTLVENNWKIDSDSTEEAIDGMVGGMMSGLAALDEATS